MDADGSRDARLAQVRQDIVDVASGLCSGCSPVERLPYAVLLIELVIEWCSLVDTVEAADSQAISCLLQLAEWTLDDAADDVSGWLSGGHAPADRTTWRLE